MFDAQLIALRDLTPLVREFIWRVPAPLRWRPGAHIQVHISHENPKRVKHYSLLPCGEPSALCIAVKRQDRGQGGSLAMWQLQVGDTLRISGPQQDFALDMRAPQYLLVAGGIGITPLVSMAHALLQRGCKFRLLYAAQSASELAYATELHALLGDRLETRIGAIEDFSPLIDNLETEAQAYVCGPSGMLQAVQQAWHKAGRSAHQLRFESFGTGVSTATNAPAQDCVVHLPGHGLRVKVPTGQSMLSAIEQAGVQAMFGCLRGKCGLCVTRVLALEGLITHRDVFLSQTQKLSNEHICICVSSVNGNITLDTAYRPDTVTADTAD